jgi:hypothetical protein
MRYFKVGGLRFLRLGRLQLSFCIVRRKEMIDTMFALLTNDNEPEPYCPLDYDDFDPADCLTPYPDDMNIDVCMFMSLIA